jgi:uncharacterized membrane protein YfcA
MEIVDLLILLSCGVSAGAIAGILGIGGGTLMVPILIALGLKPVDAVATSLMAILVISLSGTYVHFRSGQIQVKRVLALGIPAIFTVQLGALLADAINGRVLIVLFLCLLAFNFWMMGYTKKKSLIEKTDINQKPLILTMSIGAIAGKLSGLFGVGGGLIMVPLQTLWLGVGIKDAVRNSLAVIIITSVAGIIAFGFLGHLRMDYGVLLGIGGVLGAQLGSRALPFIPDFWIRTAFKIVMLLLGVWMLFHL